MDLDFNTYINEWLDLVKIMSYDYDKTKITGSVRNITGIIDVENDDCFLIKKNDNCIENEKCTVYSNKKQDICVSKTNVSNYLPSTPPNIFTTSDNKNKYEIIDAQLINDTETLRLFYKIFKSKQTSNIYVLFPDGSIDVNLNKPTINDKLNELITKIKSYKEFQKIIIAGYSMGCMMALHLASIFQTNNSSFFQDNCVVLGGGPYKGYHSNVSIPNTKVFTLGETNTETFFIDEYLYTGEYKHYMPVIFIDRSNTFLKYESIKDLKINPRGGFHELQSFIYAFKKILSKNPNINFNDPEYDYTKEEFDKIIDKGNLDRKEEEQRDREQRDREEQLKNQNAVIQYNIKQRIIEKIKELNQKYTNIKGKPFEINRSYVYLDGDIEKNITCKGLHNKKESCVDDNNRIYNHNNVWQVPSKFEQLITKITKLFGGSKRKTRKTKNQITRRRRTRNQIKRK